jgi:hypothetical protein
MRYFYSCIALLVGLLIFANFARADLPPLEEGVQVLARGPIHEAYAEPVSATPGAAPIIAREPPALLEEIPADQKPEGDVQWIPGYWAWDDDRNDFLWVSGIWRLPPPGREWIAGHWAQVDGGWQWVPGFWAASDQEELAYYPPPPDPVDAGPSEPAPTSDSVFVPGNWVYRETRYVWRPGFWRDYRPGRIWVPAHYVWTPAGYLYVEGYWDYPLRERGLLFAPVAIDSDLALRPDWFFRPRYVVDDDCLQGALFVNSDCGHYYFGDYFDAGYRRRGFLSWLDFRFGRGCYDPLFGYYRSYYGADSGWEVGLRDLYAGRFSGDLIRPPRTLIEQNTLVQNITNNNTTVNNVTNINNVTMLTPLSQVNPAIATLRPVTPQVQQAALTAAQHLRTVGGQRGNLESHLLATGTAPGKTTGTPQVVKVNLPKATVGGVAAVRNASPAPVQPTAKPQLSSGSQLKSPAAAVKPVSQRPVTQSASPKPATKPAAAPVKPVTQNRVPRPALAKPVTKPQTAPAKPVTQPRVTQPVSPKAAAQPPAAPVKPAVQHRVTQAASPKPVTKPPAAPAKPVTQPRVTQPVAPKPAVKPPAAPVKPAVQHRVTQPASPKPAAKPPPTAPVKPTPQRRVSQPSAPKPSAKPQAAPRPVARPQAPPRPVAKPQAAPAKQAAQPPARPAQVRAQPPARPAPKQAASAGKPNGHPG